MTGKYYLIVFKLKKEKRTKCSAHGTIFKNQRKINETRIILSQIKKKRENT